RQELRAISSRARISATSFVNTYDFGDLKADPLKLLDRYFDVFVYVANWGTRRFALRVPKRLIDLQAIEPFQLDDDLALVRTAGDNGIISITRDEIEDNEWDGESGHLAALAPLRADLLAGDMRLFSLLWLVQVEMDSPRGGRAGAGPHRHARRACRACRSPRDRPGPDGSSV